MAIRQGPIDLGNADARAQVTAVGRELRATRIALGQSQRAAARKAGISPSRLGRIERCELRDLPNIAVCRVARVLGLTAVLRLFPAGSPVRDAGQLAVLGRYERLLAAPLRMPREVPLPDGTGRAWDAMVVGDEGVAFSDAESRIGDVQALHRRLALKLRDDPRGRVLVLVVARTAHNREVLRAHREALRELLPLDGPAVARALRAGRLPPASGIIVL